jgi:ATP-dependent protease ClpP protease subunit
MRRPSTGLLTTSGKERVFPLRGRITRQLCGCCIARLLVFATEDRSRPILLHIDSTGGQISTALSILSTMNGIHTPIATFIEPAAEGTAIVIGTHGLRGFRVAPPDVHLSFKTFAEEVAVDNQMAALLPLLVEVLANDTKQSEACVTGWLRNGVEFNARQALELGFIDQISAGPKLPPEG